MWVFLTIGAIPVLDDAFHLGCIDLDDLDHIGFIYILRKNWLR
jgi:hypothetical protein